ncbi:hypothetical protein HanIR_Chr14g0692711 [Helianthus annuus]|nr:hypothetical protein HanIR_Chr14g0692711 [Helianthus annuus]
MSVAQHTGPNQHYTAKLKRLPPTPTPTPALPAVSTHFPCMLKPCPVLFPDIISDKETIERFPIGKCLQSPIENILVTSDRGMWDPLLFDSCGEFKLL